MPFYSRQALYHKREFNKWKNSGILGHLPRHDINTIFLYTVSQYCCNGLTCLQFGSADSFAWPLERLFSIFVNFIKRLSTKLLGNN